MSEATKTKRALVLVSFVAVAFVAATAQGDILGFFPEPASPATPEFIWDGSALSEGPGALGTGYMTAGPGDGEQPLASQAAPGLQMNVPFVIGGVLGSVTGGGSTTFYDTTLDLTTPLPEAGPAFLLGSTVIQPLGAGEFELYSTDPVTGGIEDDYEPLLVGIIHSADITGIPESDTGAVLNADVTFTGGVIAKAISANDFNGSFTWTLLDITEPLAISPTTDRLEAFTANATGHFTPEPGTLALLGIGGLLVAVRRRRNRV